MPRSQPKPLDANTLKGLGEILATEEEACIVLGFSLGGFRRKLRREPKLMEVWERGRADAKRKLRRKQMQIALGNSRGNVTMCIWLGKQFLGQRDIQLDAASAKPAEVEKLSDAELMEIARRHGGIDDASPAE